MKKWKIVISTVDYNRLQFQVGNFNLKFILRNIISALYYEQRRTERGNFSSLQMKFITAENRKCPLELRHIFSWLYLFTFDGNLTRYWMHLLRFALFLQIILKLNRSFTCMVCSVRQGHIMSMMNICKSMMRDLFLVIRKKNIHHRIFVSYFICYLVFVSLLW